MELNEALGREDDIEGMRGNCCGLPARGLCRGQRGWLVGLSPCRIQLPPVIFITILCTHNFHLTFLLLHCVIVLAIVLCFFLLFLVVSLLTKIIAGV